MSYSITFWSLFSLSIITFSGLLTPVGYFILTGMRISIGPEYYNTYCYPLVMLFLIGLIGCSLRKWLEIKAYLLIVLLSIIAGIILLIIKMPTSNSMVNFGIPITLVSLFASMIKLSIDFMRKNILLIGIALIHIAISLILIAVFINTTMSKSIITKVHLNEPIEVYGLQITYKGFEIKLSNIPIYYRGTIIPEMAYGFFKFEIKTSGLSGPLIPTLGETQMYHVLHTPKPGETLIYVWVPFNYGCGTAPRPYLNGWSLDDIYIAMVHADYHERLRPIILNSVIYGNNTNIDYIMLKIKYERLINLVWFGSLILVMGEILAYISYYNAVRRTRAKPQSIDRRREIHADI